MQHVRVGVGGRYVSQVFYCTLLTLCTDTRKAMLPARQTDFSLRPLRWSSSRRQRHEYEEVGTEEVGTEERSPR